MKAGREPDHGGEAAPAGTQTGGGNARKREVYAELATHGKDSVTDTAIGVWLWEMVKENQEDILAAARARLRQLGHKTDTSSEKPEAEL